MAGKKLGRQQLYWGPKNRRKRRAAEHLRRAAGRDLLKEMALVLLMIGFLVILVRFT
ncbi:hypothetical protein ABID82_004324 [Methylobacterium sp. PvP062]|uniref:Uncharacterized protein n=1 Tax=Methylobacterium radiotolerans TaxID=31998 RepID=A0ABV2NL11_9HYPH|nr:MULTISPECIES: hypothetical protein [unclassified Methylobacterium]KZC01487.1 hypothetical protein AU375_02411 [Methylobacterium radiotolerans]MCX4194211.1 hypothetical protein [Methylobacterium organophilum]MCX7333161.1 hypothetical protein [Hyphomicrobiales bacterium]MBP2496086.1 hypothetical protein [Methylobacterium sp. PvP105]MBP2504043.1 hypothetical protein [Methylobacterium sp. PvP109]